MIVNCPNGATIVVDDCHWTDGAYLSVTHGGGAGTILDLGTIATIKAELARIEAAIVKRRGAATVGVDGPRTKEQQGRKVA